MMSVQNQFSSFGRLRFTLAAGIACIGAAMPVADATAGAIGTEAAVPGVRSLSATPIAPRGGVMMLPLSRTDDGVLWPQHMTLTMADGRSLEGRVGVVHARPRRSGSTAIAGWTRDPRGLAIRPPSADDRAGQAGGAVLLVRLPEDATGPITLGRQRLEPVWLDRPVSAIARPEGRPTLPRSPALDRPDPDSPFEHWRWVLLAQRLDLGPPSADAFDPLAALLAEHFVDLWHVGLARLAAESPGLAQHARELLTRLCTDGDVTFAAWVADPNHTNALLNHLLNMRRTGRAFIDDVVAWTEEQERVRFWIESDAGDAVRLAVINPGANPALVRFDWAGTNEPPLAVQVEPGTLRRVSVDRPGTPEVGRPRPLEQIMASPERQPRPDVLAVTVGGRTVSVPLRPRVTQVAPPGHWLPAMRPALTLAEVQGAPMTAGPPEFAATAHVRRLRGRWEVFVECRRPHPDDDGEPRGDRAGDRRGPTSIDEARGQEAVILTVGGSNDGPAVTLIVPESGWHHLERGSNDGTLQIHRRSYDDHWICRIVLPDTWLGLLPGQPTHVAVMRTRRGTPGIDYAPVPTVPWRTHGATAALDLSSWVDLPVGQ